MATVPNYYFQSPSIADAARNLASALKPPDPRDILAQQQARWQFDRLQEQARLQDADRAANEGADQALSELALDEPAINPVTGKVDETQTGINRHQIAARAYAGGREYVDPTNKLLGIYSPTFEAESAIKAIGAQAQENFISQRAANQMAYGNARDDRLDQRQQNLFAHQMDIEEFKKTAQFQFLNARAQHNLDAIKARAQGAGGNATKISGKTLEDLIYLMSTKISNSGASMPQAAQDELLVRMAISASKSGDLPLAVDEVWQAAGLPDAPEPEEPGIVSRFMRGLTGNAAPGVLHPNFGPRPEPPGASGAPAGPTPFSSALAPAGVSQYDFERGLEGGGNSGAPIPSDAVPDATLPPEVAPVMLPPRKAAPAPARTPPRVPRGSAGGPKEGAHAKSKSGKSMTYHGGQWVYD